MGVALARSGCEVVLVARGAHGEAIRRHGLTLRTPELTATESIPCVARPGEAGLGAADVVILAVKAHDVAAALAEVDGRVAVVCAQNGVTSEPLVAAHQPRVYGLMAWIPAVHLEPGVVEVYAAGRLGALRIGRHPGGVDDLAGDLAGRFAAAGFDAAPVADISRWKHGKLLANLGNVIDAFCEPDPGLGAIARRAGDEGAAVLTAAGLPFIPVADLYADMRARVDHRAAIDGRSRPGGSTWQSAARGLACEVEHLNGWICDLGRRVGVATPVNDVLRRLPALASGPRTVALARLDDLIGGVS